ncbi:hypothetical protein ACWGOE_07395 [Leucobacter chromiiresistens]
MSSAIDRLTDDFPPHGTLEGERAGCLGADCPARPFRCRDVGGRYRSDFKFKKLYSTGLRGDDLAAALELGAPAKPAAPATVEPPESDTQMDRALWKDDWSAWTIEERDAKLIEWVEAGLTWRAIADRIGSSAPAVSRLFNAARRRRVVEESTLAEQQETVEQVAREFDESARDGLDSAAVEELREKQELTPDVDMVEVKSHDGTMVATFPAVPTNDDETFYPQPSLHPWQVRQLFVLLDHNGHIVMASSSREVAESWLSDVEGDE